MRMASLGEFRPNISASWRPPGASSLIWSPPLRERESEAGMGKQVQESPRVEDQEKFTPRSALGRQLWEIRQRNIAKGCDLLSWDEIDARLERRVISHDLLALRNST